MKKNCKWQACVRRWIGERKHGLRVTGVRRRGRGTFISPKEAPQEVRDFLLLNDYDCIDDEDLKTLDNVVEACNRDDQKAWKVSACEARIFFSVEEARQPHMKPLKRLIRDLASDTCQNSLYGIYRCVYKWTDCGPSMGALVNDKWIYCDSLKELGSLDDMRQRGDQVFALGIAGYVEGWDGECSFETIDGTGKMPTLSDFWNLVELANQEANDIWMQTHGCDDCFGGQDVEGQYGMKLVDNDCPTCGGQGAVI